MACSVPGRHHLPRLDVLDCSRSFPSSLIQVKETVRGAVNQVLGTAEEKGEEAKDAGKRTLEETKQRTSGAYEDAKDQGKKTWNQ